MTVNWKGQCNKMEGMAKYIHNFLCNHVTNLADKIGPDVLNEHGEM